MDRHSCVQLSQEPFAPRGSEDMFRHAAKGNIGAPAQSMFVPIASERTLGLQRRKLLISDTLPSRNVSSTDTDLVEAGIFI